MFNRPTLCVDFDGVIHWYREGWKDINNIYDVPVPGSLRFIKESQKYFNVMVLSSRGAHDEGVNGILNWMRQFGYPELPITHEKPPTFLSIDDRALCFQGDFWDPKELRNFRPWNVKPKK